MAASDLLEQLSVSFSDNCLTMPTVSLAWHSFKRMIFCTWFYDSKLAGGVPDAPV